VGHPAALSVILAAETENGDTIATERFTYPGVRAAADQLGVNVAGVATDQDGILPEALEALCRHRNIRLLYCNPSLTNPTNTISPMSRREEIAKVAEQYGLAIIEDEIMRPMLTEHPGFITNLLPHQSFLIVSASKVIAAGLRVGFILAPSNTRQRLVESLNASCLGMPSLTAELISTWLDDGTADRVIARRRADAAERQKLVSEMLAGLKFHNHPASYHVWLELPEGWDGMKFAMEAQLRGVVVTPSEAFATDDKSPIDAVRLSLAGPPSLEILKSGLNTIVNMLGGASGHNLAMV
jgi:DNA-binding transcriptional MocR family regulator